MAAYRFEAKIIGRSGGRSAVHAASHNTGKSAVRAVSYRMREALTDERTGITHDYSRKFGGNGSDLFLPPDAPSWMGNRQTLWNAVEKSERRADAQLARDFVITLPYALTHEQHRAVIKDFVTAHFTSKGKVADVGYHAYGEPYPAGSEALPERMEKWKREGVVFYDRGQVPNDFNTRHVVVLRNRQGEATGYVRYQPHAHVMVPLRKIEGGQFSKLKDRAPEGTHPMKHWKNELEELRKGWADTLNQHFQSAGIDERVDHRSLVDRGIERKPEPKKGPIAAQMEREGRPSHAGTDWKNTRDDNAQIAQIEAEIVNLHAERLTNIVKGTAPMELTEGQAQQRENMLHGDFTKAQAHIDLADEYLRDQQRIMADAAKQREERERDEWRKARDHDVADPHARWAKALGRTPGGADNFATMAAAARNEGADFRQRQEDYRQQEAKETDPQNRRVIELKRHVEASDYMAVTSERLVGISRVISGRRGSESELYYQDEATKYREIGQQEREKLRDLRDRMEQQAVDRFHDGIQSLEKEVRANSSNRSRANASAPGTEREEWRAVEKGEVLQPGAHVRMNIKEGTSEIRVDSTDRSSPDRDLRDRIEQVENDGAAKSRPAERSDRGHDRERNQDRREAKLEVTDKSEIIAAKLQAYRDTDREREQNQSQRTGGRGR